MSTNSKYKTLIKNIGVFTIGSFGSKLISFLLVGLYTSVLETSDYGTVDLMSTTVQLLLPILTLCIYEATLRFCMDKNYNKSDVLSSSLSIVWKGTLILAVLLSAVVLLGIFNLSLIYWAFLFVSFIFTALNNCFSVYLKSVNKTSIIAISGIGCTLITCGLNVLFLLVIELGIYGYMLSSVLGIAFQVLFQFVAGKVYKDVHWKKYTKLYKPMLAYSIPLIANGISWWINNVSDRYIVTAFKGVEVNGVYSIAYKIPTILSVVQSIFYSAWSISAISEFNKEDDDGFIGKNYSLYSSVSIVCCSVILLINIPLAKVLYAGDYFIAWQCVPFLLVGTILNGMAQFEGTLFAAAKKTKLVSITTIVGAIVNTLLNLILIPFISSVGAALATMVGYAFIWILRSIFLRKFIKMKVNWVENCVLVIIVLIQSILATIGSFYIVQGVMVLLIIILLRKYLIKALSILKR